MTLLARRPGLSTSDFRAYWAGPHAKLALGMAGIGGYRQNRVDKLLWCSHPHPGFEVDGIAELSFLDGEAMRSAQASPIGQRLIPADEPQFLRGWTLCVMEPTPLPRRTTREGEAKVMLPFRLAGSTRQEWAAAAAEAASRQGAAFELNWTHTTARRVALWSEPEPPDGMAVYWFASVADAHLAFEPGLQLVPESSTAMACLVDELRLL